MSILMEKNGKKVLPFSFYAKILVFFCIVGISVLFMQPLQVSLNQVMIQIRTEIIENIESNTGLKIGYSSIRPSFFGSFDIRNLRFMKSDEAFLTVSRVRFKFSIMDLIIKKKILFHTIQIDRPVFNIDTQRDKDTLDFFSSLFKNEDNQNLETDIFKQIANFLPQYVNYQIRNGYFYLVDDEMTCLIEDLNVNIQDKDGKFILDGNFNAEFKYISLFNTVMIFKTKSSINGTLSNNLEESSADLSFSYITYSQHDNPQRNVSFFRVPDNTNNQRQLFNIHPFKITVSYRDAVIRAAKSMDDTSHEYYLQYETDNGVFRVNANFDNFRLGDIAEFSDQWKNLNHLLQMQINGSASFYYDLILNSMYYSANLTGGIASVFSSSLLPDTFVINANGNEKEIFIRDLIFSSSVQTARAGFFHGIIGYSGKLEFAPLLPSGTVFLDRFSLTGKENITSVFNVSSRENEIQITTDRIDIASTLINDFKLIFNLAEKDMGINVSCFNMDNGAVYLDAVFNRNPNQLEASVTLDFYSIYELMQITKPFIELFNIPFIDQTIQRNSVVSADFFFSTDFNNLVYNAPNMVFNIGGIKGYMSLSGTDRHFLLNEGLIYFNENELFVSANLNYSNPMDLSFRVNANYLNFAWTLDGQILDRSTLLIYDPNGLHVYGNLSSSGALSGYIEGNNFPLPYDDVPVYLTFYSALRYNSMDFWNIDINHFRAVYNGANFYSISGIVDQDGANFKEITINDSVGKLTGNADFTWDHNFSYIEFAANLTDGFLMGENYKLEGFLRDEQINIKAIVNDMHVNRFIKGDQAMLLTAEISASWSSIDSFDIQASVLSFRTRLQNEYLYASVGLNLNDKNLYVQNLRMDYANARAILPEIYINREEGILKANSSIINYTFGGVEGKVVIDARFNHIKSWIDVRQIINSFDGTLLVENIKYRDINRDDMLFLFSRNEGSLYVSGGISDMIRLEMENNGEFILGVSAPFPVHGTFIGTFRNGIVDAHTSFYYLDISTLYSYFAIGNDFNIAGGYITGQMDVRGPILNPEFFGYGRATSIRLQVPDYVSEDLRLVPFLVIAQGYDVTFDPVILACGNGGGSVSGWLHFINWKPANIGLDIFIPRNTPIPYALNITGFLAEGTASGNLTLNYDDINSSIELIGNLYTNYAEIGLNMDELPTYENNNMFDVDFQVYVDLTVTTGSMVEFIWPTRSPMIRANPEIGTVVSIYSDPQARQFLLNSDVRIRSGEIYYFDRSFFIRQGNIVFRETENLFDPRITARAEIRDRSDTGIVTISMIVDNQPLLNFEPRFESSPGLTQLEIYSILGHNFGANQGNDNTDMAQRFLISSTADLITQIIAGSETLSQLIFLRQIEKQIRDLLGLDMFSIRTRFLQNAIYSGFTGLGQPPVDRNQGVGNYFDNTTVFIGKYIGRDMFLHGMLRMRYNENNTTFGGLIFEPEIGIEWQSPYVNIRWDFFPYNPENWWVSGNSITLSWNWSF